MCVWTPQHPNVNTGTLATGPSPSPFGAQSYFPLFCFYASLFSPSGLSEILCGMKQCFYHLFCFQQDLPQTWSPWGISWCQSPATHAGCIETQGPCLWPCHPPSSRNGATVIQLLLTRLVRERRGKPVRFLTNLQ